MSIKAVRWAEAQKLPPNHALLLRTLAWTINARGHGWLSQPKMAIRSNKISIATVKRCLKDFRRLGLLSSERAREEGRMINCYRIDLKRTINWDHKQCSWAEYVRREEVMLAERVRQAGEAKADFVHRELSRLNAGVQP